MIKVKICGITRLEDAFIACNLGAWALGFIFVKSSPRYIEKEKAFSIIKNIPKTLEKIGVFADISVDEIQSISNKSKITKVQLHGCESPEFCQEVYKVTGLPVIKALRVKNEDDLRHISLYKGNIEAVLLDSYSPLAIGGTGEVFNWEIAKNAKNYNIPVILAGGINPDNINSAYKKAEPYAIDLSSGVESSKGIKDKKKLIKLFSAISLL